MREGRLGYNSYNKRYGLLSSDLWIDPGFHCGECLEVLVDDQWVKTRMEMNLAREWYLVGTPYCGRSGVCMGKDTGIKQTDREIADWLLVIKISPDTGRKRGRIRPK